MLRCIYKCVMTMVVCICILYMTGCNMVQSVQDIDSHGKISINGLELGEKMPTGMVDKAQVMDAPFRFMHDDVGFDVDADRRVEYLSYYTTFNTSDANIGFKDAKIVYNDQEFETLENMVAYFQENNQLEESTDDDTLYYEDDICEVKISYDEENFYGIVIKKK